MFYNINLLFCEILLSLPSWERGLKYNVINGLYDNARSLPSWERGLKSTEPYMDKAMVGRSLRGSVD